MLGPDKQPGKSPIKCLQTYLYNYDQANNIETLAIQFPNTSKWTTYPDIDNELSNAYRLNPTITTSQKTIILKFCTGSYVGKARKQLFFERDKFPSITCSICNSTDADTWPHALLKCNHYYIHAIRVKRHNKVVWKLRKLILASQKLRCFTLMNAETFNNNPQENTVPSW